jgi:hypothetical protein
VVTRAELADRQIDSTRKPRWMLDDVDVDRCTSEQTRTGRCYQIEHGVFAFESALRLVVTWQRRASGREEPLYVDSCRLEAHYQPWRITKPQREWV